MIFDLISTKRITHTLREIGKMDAILFAIAMHNTASSFLNKNINGMHIYIYSTNLDNFLMQNIFTTTATNFYVFIKFLMTNGILASLNTKQNNLKTNNI